MGISNVSQISIFMFKWPPITLQVECLDVILSFFTRNIQSYLIIFFPFLLVTVGYKFQIDYNTSLQ